MGLCGTACLSHNSGKTEWQQAIAINFRPPKARLVSLIYPGPTYHLFRLSLPLPPKFEEVEIVVFPAICTYLAQLVQQNLIYWEPRARPI